MKFTADAKPLKTAVVGVKMAVAKKNNRPTLEQIELCVSGDKLTITGMNGVVLAQRVVKIRDGEDGTCDVDPDMLLSVLQVSDFVRCVADHKVFHVSNGLADYAFPLFCEGEAQYDHFWPEYDHTTEFRIDASNLILALQAATKGEKSSFVRVSLDRDNPTKPVTIRMDNGNRAIACTMIQRPVW